MDGAGETEKRTSLSRIVKLNHKHTVEKEYCNWRSISTESW